MCEVFRIVLLEYLGATEHVRCRQLIFGPIHITEFEVCLATTEMHERVANRAGAQHCLSKGLLCTFELPAQKRAIADCDEEPQARVVGVDGLWNKSECFLEFGDSLIPFIHVLPFVTFFRESNDSAMQFIEWFGHL